MFSLTHPPHPHFHQTFFLHEVDGELLVNCDDFDLSFLIKKPSHRAKILKEVEEQRSRYERVVGERGSKKKARAKRKVEEWKEENEERT